MIFCVLSTPRSFGETRQCAAASEPVPSHAAQPKQRLLENEQRPEDTQAVKLTEEQYPSLFPLPERQFQSSCPALPLPPVARSPCLPAHANAAPGTRDPIRPPALPLPPHVNAHHSYSYLPPAHPHPYSPAQPQQPPAPTPEAFAVLTNAHLASFGRRYRLRAPAACPPHLHTLRDVPGATPRIRRRPHPHPPSTYSTHAFAFPVSPHRSSAPRPRPTPAPTYISTLSPPTPPGVPPMVRSASSPPPPVRTSLVPRGKPRSSPSSRGKRRSPVKGLFPFSLSSSHSASAASTPCLIRVPLPPLISVDADAPDEDNEDARLLAPRTPPALGVNVHVGAAPAYYESKGEGEPQTPVPGLHSREATPAPYSRGEERERGREGEGEQVGGKRKR
ncbi:hypothetical protein B0H14DRAFT_3787907 [Mycena olivaceomarginata]|nr:hypothetical protein B0H14DRAFT_3787907 [Mycena olivaceomarginata]